MASQDEGDGQEAAVDILSYNISNNDQVQLDPNAEYAGATMEDS